MTSIMSQRLLWLLSTPALYAAQATQIPVTPIAFEPNAGQADAQVKFLAHLPQAMLWMTDREVVLGQMRLQFRGGDTNPKIEPEEPVPGISNYFIGNDRSQWRTDIRHFSKVRYRDVYPGIDVVFYGNPGKLEYDFVLRAGADPSRIRLAFEGIESLKTEDGALVVKTGDAEIRNLPPVILQDGKKVGGRWVVRGKKEAAFVVDAYNRTRPLIIDPVMTYGSFLGGNLEEGVTGIAIDAQGNILVCGFSTANGDFPTQNALYPVYGPPNSTANISFVAKFNPAASGTASLVYSTFFATGSTLVRGSDAHGVATDQSGNAYLVGVSYDNLPLVNPLPGQSTYLNDNECGAIVNGSPGVGPCGHGFVAEISPAGNQLLFCSYLGGSDGDKAYAVTVDRAGNIYVAGYTHSPDFPIAGYAVQSQFKGILGAIADAFVTRITPGRTIDFSTYFGSGHGDTAYGIAVDSGGNIYVCGESEGAGLPVTTGAFQHSYPGDSSEPLAGFVAIVNPAVQASLVYSTYLSGTDDNTILNAVATDGAGNVYVAGTSAADDFPVTASAIRGPTTADNPKAVAVKLNPSAQGSAQLVYSTIVGGGFTEAGNGIAVGPSGLVTVVGTTASPNFPTTANAFQPYYAGYPDANGNPDSVGFLSQLDMTQSGLASLVYSTFVGGTQGSALTAVALDATGKILAVGGAMSDSGAPITSSAYQTKYAGGDDAYVARFDLSQTGALTNIVENGASLSADIIGELSPGLIFTLKGTGMGPTIATGGTIDPTTLGVSTSAGGVQVLVNNTPCPLLYLSATQINAIAPYEIASLVNQYVSVQVIYNGVPGNLSYMRVSATEPGIFSFDDGSGQGAILNQDSSINGMNNPAARGSVVQIFATGEGQTVPPGVDGAIANEPLGQIPAPAAKLSLTIGGMPATLTYAGTLPGGVAGALQIDATVPANAPTGAAVPVVLTVGANSSPNSLTMAVK